MKIAKATPFLGKPVINMPSVFGACTGKDVLCRIPVIGQRPIQISVSGLADGLILKDNIITGKVMQDCEFEITVTAVNELGTDSRTVLFKIHEDTMLLTPLMGFTSWNAYAYTVTQQNMEDTAHRILSQGLADYGYSYMNIDSTWQKEYGGKFDAIQPNEKFPDMKGYCDRMHALGYKCGIYSTPMLKAWGYTKEMNIHIPGCTRGEADILFTCQNDGIGIEHLEENNVMQWEQWGFDYLKYDWKPCDPTNADLMKKALLKANREIAFCVTVDANLLYYKYWSQNCCSWRCNIDSMDIWSRVKYYLSTVDGWKPAVRQGHFYDLDMLEIGGMFWNDGQTRLTENEAIFAYTLRAFFLSPIQLSCRIDNLTDFEFDLIANEEIIRINQDSLADYPEPISELIPDIGVGDTPIYKRMLENGDTAIALFNASDEEIIQELDLGDYISVRDLWRKEDLLPSNTFQCTIDPHCAVVLRVSK